MVPTACKARSQVRPQERLSAGKRRKAPRRSSRPRERLKNTLFLSHPLLAAPFSGVPGRPALVCARKIVLSSDVRGCPRGNPGRSSTCSYSDVRGCPGGNSRLGRRVRGLFRGLDLQGFNRGQPETSCLRAIVFSQLFQHGLRGVFQTGGAREIN